MSTGIQAPGRDRYLDTLRAVALARVVAFHSFSGAVWMSLVFPSMGVMFALAGALMARSLDRPAAGVLKSRARRLLLPLWLYAVTVLGLLFLTGWRPWQEEEGYWLDLALWFVPVGTPPFPESAGTNGVLTDSSWGFQAEEILWYIRAYFWFMLLSPLLLKAFRRFPWVTLLAPLGLLAVLTLENAALPEWANNPVTDFITFGSCWVLGFAHHDGLLRKLRFPVVVVLALALMVLGLAWAATHPSEEGWNLNEIPLAQALWSLGYCAVLLRLSPVWPALPGRMKILDGVVTLVNNRAITIYLWHNLLLVAAVPLIDLGWENPVLSEAFPWLLESDWLLFLMVWPLLGAAILCVGWVEDLAAGRTPRLWPAGAGTRS
ncbi:MULTISPECIES: acyltransferase family protein [unclassified Arthrobacter]|jgi:peptidoglycan/LPS O-acetylase OafA/YrhL|uniref:acyltransferase family protein n=1 Tax=unclassified Arthrobacter TaxID=235627 RepID=UPI0009A58A87|nr:MULTISPECIES: acyltransferase [unclassified Arthrobacter]RDV10197.1 acyltransferase [Arthrobacter sp. RT-1]SLK07502.1 Peptidoglycan/LPS O-acetylase OafA/YrhL, contains acyltransferase and SGNH-hydrolase domains [Arthrobacter sp. P2b]